MSIFETIDEQQTPFGTAALENVQSPVIFSAKVKFILPLKVEAG